MIRSFRTAVRTLTILPLPGQDAKNFGMSLFFFPVVGGILALINCLIAYVLGRYGHANPLINAAILVGITAFLTGFLHLDGLADSADGFGGGRGNKEKILAIMKDSRIGTFGAVGLIMAILLKTTCYGDILTTNFTLVCLISFGMFILSRTFVATALSIMTYAGSSQGTAQPFSGNKQFRIPLIAEFIGITLILLMICNKIQPDLIKTLTLSMSLSILSSCLLCVYFYKRIQGITGDCLGAIVEVFEIVFFVSFCIIH
jgi:adenosylcobinamide-GDP ribazoletransferase